MSKLTLWNGKKATIEEFVQKHLDGNDYGRGAVEAATATGNNLLEAYSRLINLLAQRGVLSEDDIFYVVKGYKHGSLE